MVYLEVMGKLVALEIRSASAKNGAIYAKEVKH